MGGLLCGGDWFLAPGRMGPPGGAALQPFSKAWRPEALPFPPFHALKPMQVGIKPCCSHAPLPRGLARVQLDDKGAPCTHAACPRLTLPHTGRLVLQGGHRGSLA